jgi:uracil-DNA glycosylase
VLTEPPRARQYLRGTRSGSRSSVGGRRKSKFHQATPQFLHCHAYGNAHGWLRQRYQITMNDRPESLSKLVAALRGCHRCPQMQFSPVSGGPVSSRVILVGQAPGLREPQAGRPFAWTAGKTLFKWFYEVAGVDEDNFRATVYMAAVCRCFPGKTASGDRVPSRTEIANCSSWLDAEIALLSPGLVIPVGKLAITQFIQPAPGLTEVIGQRRAGERAGKRFDVVALPHPSGASPWHRMEPGRALTRKALELIRDHPVWKNRTR